MTSREYNTHPFISCGTGLGGKGDASMREAVKRIVMPIFEKSLKETNKNRMSVGSVRSDVGDVVYYQPHNYKLWFDYSKVSAFLPPSEKVLKGLNTRRRLPRSRVFKLINHDKEFCFPDFLGCRIVVHKKTIEVVNKINHKQWFPIRVSDPDLIDARISEIISLKDDECRRVLEDFIGVVGGSSGFSIVNSYGEHKVIGEDKIDLIPAKTRFHGDVVKKVYGEKNVEFKTAAHAANYLSNRALESVVPAISDKLDEIMRGLSGVPLVSGLEGVKMDVKVFPDDVFRFERDIKLLSDGDKFLLSNWFFEQFGGLGCGC